VGGRPHLSPRHLPFASVTQLTVLSKTFSRTNRWALRRRRIRREGIKWGGGRGKGREGGRKEGGEGREDEMGKRRGSFAISQCLWGPQGPRGPWWQKTGLLVTFAKSAQRRNPLT